jgi:hypothetical protein
MTPDVRFGRPAVGQKSLAVRVHQHDGSANSTLCPIIPGLGYG